MCRPCSGLPPTDKFKRADWAFQRPTGKKSPGKQLKSRANLAHLFSSPARSYPRPNTVEGPKTRFRENRHTVLRRLTLSDLAFGRIDRIGQIARYRNKQEQSPWPRRFLHTA